MNAKDRKERDIIPSFMRSHKGRGLENLTVEDFDWDLDETREEMKRIIAGLRQRGVPGRETKKRPGRPTSDDLELLLGVADVILKSLRSPRRRELSWSRAVEKTVSSTRNWQGMNELQRDTLIRRIRGKFVLQAAPLLEAARRRTHATSQEISELRA